MPKSTQIKLQDRQLVSDNIEYLSTSMPALCARFFTHLFRLDSSQMEVFDGSAVFLNRKFSSMMATFRNATRLDDMEKAIAALSCRHIRYGMRSAHLPAFKQAFMLALSEHLNEKFSDSLREAWHSVYDDTMAMMEKSAEKQTAWNDNSAHQKDHFHDSQHDTGLLEDIGGIEVITRIHQAFYDIIFEDSWIGQFFLGKHKKGLIRKQTEFMVAAFGGPNTYSGQPPALVHMHMFITDEMAIYREKILRQCIYEEGLSQNIADRWLAVDRSFWPSINKEKVSECVTTCPGQLPITIK